MNMKNVKLLMKKDWKGTIMKKEILLPMILLPVLFTILLPIGMLMAVIIDPESITSDFGDIEPLLELMNINPAYNPVLKYSIFMIQIMILPMFLMIPAIIPVMIASDSFAGEKERKTMENLALLPISKIELIFGKVLTAFIPSLVITFACFAGMGAIVNLMILEYLEGTLLIFGDISFLLVVFLMSPLLAFLNILIGTIISSRVKDLKSAQSVGGSLISPAIIILFVQLFNPTFLTPIPIIVISGIIGGLCLLFVDVANRLLDIERLILTL